MTWSSSGDRSKWRDRNFGARRTFRDERVQHRWDHMAQAVVEHESCLQSSISRRRCGGHRVVRALEVVSPDFEAHDKG